MNKWKHPQNSGWEDVLYDFGLGEEGNKRVGYLLNEACHVFYYHADGNWKANKEKYAKNLSQEFMKYPKLSGRVIQSNDRVVKMIAHRALEILNE